MSNMKRRKNHNDATLTFRIPSQILAQLTTIADAQFKNPSQVVRDLIVQHIQNNQAIFVAQGHAQPQITPKQTNAIRPPSQQYDEWD